ncbi:MAG: carboxylesterase family protein [Selenomonadaceae bacterium]|nr:carboxylesterase family protein [Selenomonadaceae bacterium]
MKKIFTIDEFMVCFVTAIGSGLGFEIPKTILGFEEWQCLLVSIIASCTLGTLVGKVVFSKTVQSKAINRFSVFFACILIFFAVQYVVVSFSGVSLYNYLTEEPVYAIISAVLGFGFGMIIRWYRIRKIRERYGDGSDGFLYDDLLEKNGILEELNQQNQSIKGSFDAELAVKTKTGFFVGGKLKNSMFFCGIPYAKPPVGELRWKAPEPLPESEEVFEAKHFGASAIQVDYDGSISKHHRQSEDCLYLNICVGTKTTDKKKKVLVIFHHGDFSYGGAADPLFNGDEHFIKIYPDAIGVTFNYRLGILGFIDFSEVPGGDKYPDALNLGLLDQIAALRWIKENISAFGGDPEKITLMGFESGALSISLLAASEQAKGLFQKAFIFHENPMMAFNTPEISRKLAKKLLQETSTTTMEELLSLSTERLKEATQKLLEDLSYPTFDDKLIPLDVYDAYKKGSASGVEFLIGIARNERHVFKSFVGNKKYEDFVAKETDNFLKYLNACYPDVVKDVNAYIEEQTKVMSALEAKEKFVEQVYALSTYQCAKKLVESGNKVHILYWDVNPLIKNLGSGTVDVLATFLGNSEAAQIYGNVLNQDIAETLQNLFRKFISGEELKLFNNEIKGISAIDWKEAPQALIISEKAFRCEPITDKLTEVKGLLKILEQ